MRMCYAIVAAAAIIAAHSETVVAVANSKQNHLAADNSPLSIDAAQITSSTKRSLRVIKKLEKLVVKQPKTITIEELLKTKELDAILDPKRLDKIFAKGKLGGWMDRETLDKVLSGNFAQKTEVFKQWHADGRTSKLVTQLLKSDPALEHKYRYAYKMYGGYLQVIFKQENRAKRLAAAAAAAARN